MKKIEMTDEFEVEFDGSINSDGDVEDLYVGVIIKGTSIAIESLLNQKQRTYFEEKIVQEAIGQEESARERAENQKFQEMRDERLTRKEGE